MSFLSNVAPVALYAGAALCFVAALIHFACIHFGGPAFRLLGAGEALARMSERGHWYPSLVASAIGVVLLVWSGYALSGAGVIVRFPFTKYALVGIAVVFLLRAVSFPLLKPAFPENSRSFWLVSSGICLVIGACFLVGVVGTWSQL